jgi:hypothetical protein
VYVQPGASYPACNVADGNQRTAWVSMQGQAAGDALLLGLQTETYIDSIAIGNGFQRDANSWGMNGRVEMLRVIVDGGVYEDLPLAPSQDTYNSLESVPLSDEMRSIPTTRLIVQALQYTPDLHNVAVSEIEVFGRPVLNRESEVPVIPWSNRTQGMARCQG